VDGGAQVHWRGRSAARNEFAKSKFRVFYRLNFRNMRVIGFPSPILRLENGDGARGATRPTLAGQINSKK
jgi:hypothetical protein